MSLGTQCIYLESRVGKVPGIRAKKRRLENDKSSDQAPSYPAVSTSVSQASLQPAIASVSSPEPSLLDHDSRDQAWQWDTASQLDPYETSCEFLESQASSTIDTTASKSSMVSVSLTDNFMPELNFDLGEIWNPPPPQQVSSSTMPPPSTQRPIETVKALVTLPDDAQKGGKENDSRCVVQCCHLVTDLESYIIADMDAFQILLGIARKANEKLDELIRSQQSSRNLRCLMLFNTICYQIIELLSACHRAIATPNDQRRTSILMPGGLGLGGLGLDEEEQTAWQAQRMLKEINQGCEIVAKLKLLAGVGPDHSTSGATPQATAREHCYVDLERRLRELAAEVKTRT